MITVKIQRDQKRLNAHIINVQSRKVLTKILTTGGFKIGKNFFTQSKSVKS
jgi:hypothetical protein